MTKWYWSYISCCYCWRIKLKFSSPEQRHHPNKQIIRLQNALCAVTKTLEHHHITFVLKTPPWLKMPERIEYKILLLTYNTLQSSALKPPSAGHNPTKSFLLHPNTSPSICHLVTKISQSLPGHRLILVTRWPPWYKLPPVLRQISDPPYELSSC